MKKNRLILGSVCILLTIGLIQLWNKTSPFSKEQKSITKVKKQGADTKVATSPSRKISSIRSKVSRPKIRKTPETPSPKREYVGSFSNLKNITFINKVDKNWKKKYKHNFQRMVKGQNFSNFKVKVKKSIVKVKGNIGRNLEHVIISYKKPNGQPFSFEALIDSESGHLVQTWNKTQYEFKKPFKVKAEKYLYKKEI